jgi:hypothetical protein
MYDSNKTNTAIEILPHHLLGSRGMDMAASSSKADGRTTVEVSSRVGTGIRTNKHHRRTDLPISTSILNNSNHINRATIFAMSTTLQHPTSNSETVGTSRVASNSLVLALTL